MLAVSTPKLLFALVLCGSFSFTLVWFQANNSSPGGTVMPPVAFLEQTTSPDRIFILNGPSTKLSKLESGLFEVSGFLRPVFPSFKKASSPTQFRRPIWHSRLSAATKQRQLVSTKRNKIVQMIKHAWKGYEKFAWGGNQLRPLRQMADDNRAIFGSKTFGATIIDSLGTLYLVGLMDEYTKAKKWVEEEFSFQGSFDVSVFEINIRFVGGLLSAYAVTKEEVFLAQAEDVARKLLPAFNTSTGIPRSLVNLETGESFNWPWAGFGQCGVLAEMGTLSMEFLYLSQLTGDNEFRDKIVQVFKQIKNSKNSDGLYCSYVNTDTGRCCNEHSSVGAMSDSFYEYLFKVWLLSGGRESSMKAAYDEAIETIFSQLLIRSQDGHYFFADKQGDSYLLKMDHLACFLGGLLALSAKFSTDKERFMETADAIGETCHLYYNSTATGLGPEVFRFDSSAIYPADRPYLLRPEAVETYFYMWRLTHHPKWRQYGWEVAQAIEKHCRTSGGYSGIVDVYSLPVDYDDNQNSFFIAETLKYLYLLFSPDDVLPLDQFVFNTEGHPFPIKT